VTAALLLAARSSFSDAPGGPDSARPLPGLLDQALKLEQARQFTRAEKIYGEVVRRCDGEQSWRIRRDAAQGLVRIAHMKALFCWNESQLQAVLAKTYQGWQPSELADYERRGWMNWWEIDGNKVYAASDAGNLKFFDTALMARDETSAKRFRQFAQIFLDESAKLDALRAARRVPEGHVVAPVRMVFTRKAVIHQADLPPGRVVRAWFAYPLLSPAVQNIRTLSVEPAGALRCCPDVEGETGIAYLEVPRPQNGDVTIELKVAFDAYDTDFRVDPDAIPPYDVHSEFYRRFTRSEQQMALTPALLELARSAVGAETNSYRKARKLYDWVCDHCKYNFTWNWRDATFAYGCASEEVRQRRIGDCVIQSVFYATLCRAAGIPARVQHGLIFPPGLKTDHVWAEVCLPPYGWLPVDVTYSEGAGMAPGLTDAQRRTIRDFFFGRMDRWRFSTQRNDLAQELVPPKRSERRDQTMIAAPEFECGGRNVEKAATTWECRPPADEDTPARPATKP
jgi:transglutaminase-like putative cysteine protease